MSRRRIRRVLATWLALLACALGASALPPAAGAQAVPAPAAGGAEAPPAAPDEEPRPAGPDDPLGRGTPQGAMRGFLEAGRHNDWARAARYLDLRRVPKAEREEEGPDLARQLKTVLDRTLWVELEHLSNEPEGRRDDGLPSYRDTVGFIEQVEPPVPIYVDRVAREDDGVRIWKVSQNTVQRIPALWDQFGDGPLAEHLPAPFFRIGFLSLQLWQWLGLLVLAGLAFALAALLARIAQAVLARTLFKRFPALHLTIGPLRLLLALGLFAAWRFLLNLSVPAEEVVAGVLRGATVLVVTWLGFRLVDAAEKGIAARARHQVGASSLLALGRRIAKALLVVLAVLVALQSLGVNVTALLAGVGFGGLALALAAQKTLENLFGGVTIAADQPVRVGDFCRFGDRMGIVEDVGLRSTRIRTLDRTLVTVPNAEFSVMQIENYSRRDRIWFHPTIRLRYETTPDQIRFVLVELRKMLYAHPKVHPDPARVRFVGLGEYSLDLEVFAYVLTTDFNEYLEVAEDLNLRIMELVARAGTGFALPSSRMYVGRDDGLDAEAARRAEQQVAEWRARQELYLPSFPPDAIRALDDTLDYPPEGSALRRHR